MHDLVIVSVTQSININLKKFLLLSELKKWCFSEN